MGRIHDRIRNALCKLLPFDGWINHLCPQTTEDPFGAILCDKCSDKCTITTKVGKNKGATRSVADRMGKPADFASILNGVMWFQVALAGIFIGLRLYTRQYIIRNIGWDDVLMIVNLVRLCLYYPTVARTGTLNA